MPAKDSKTAPGSPGKTGLCKTPYAFGSPAKDKLVYSSLAHLNADLIRFATSLAADRPGVAEAPKSEEELEAEEEEAKAKARERALKAAASSASKTKKGAAAGGNATTATAATGGTITGATEISYDFQLSEPCDIPACKDVLRQIADREVRNVIDRQDMGFKIQDYERELVELEEANAELEAKAKEVTTQGHDLDEQLADLTEKLTQCEEDLRQQSVDQLEMNNRLMQLSLDRQRLASQMRATSKCLSLALWSPDPAPLDIVHVNTALTGLVIKKKGEGAGKSRGGSSNNNNNTSSSGGAHGSLGKRAQSGSGSRPSTGASAASSSPAINYAGDAVLGRRTPYTRLVDGGVLDYTERPKTMHASNGPAFLNGGGSRELDGFGGSSISLAPLRASGGSRRGVASDDRTVGSAFGPSSPSRGGMNFFDDSSSVTSADTFKSRLAPIMTDESARRSWGRDARVGAITVRNDPPGYKRTMLTSTGHPGLYLDGPAPASPSGYRGGTATSDGKPGSRPGQGLAQSSSLSSRGMESSSLQQGLAASPIRSGR